MGPNESGEICWKFPFPALGYYKNPTATKKAFDADGWFLTGDIGYFDDECFLFHEGRMGDFIKFRGLDGVVSNLNCASMDGIIAKETGQRQVCVFGLNLKNAAYELPAVAIVASVDCKFSESGIMEVMTEKYWPKHLEGGVYFVSELPKTVTGKIKRRETQEMVTDLIKRGITNPPKKNLVLKNPYSKL